MRATAQNTIDDDDEEEDERSDGTQRVLLREDPISLEQVRSGFRHPFFKKKKHSFDRFAPSRLGDMNVQARRIAMQSAWRSTRG